MPKKRPPRRVKSSSGDALLHRIRVGMRADVALGERHVDLHRPARSHRVRAGEEALAERHHADEVLEDLAQLALGPARGRSARRSSRRSTTRGATRHAPRAAARRPARRAGRSRPRRSPAGRRRRVGVKARLLLGDGDDGARVLRRDGDVLDREGGVDVGGPAVRVSRSRGQHAGDQRARLRRRHRRRRGRGRRRAAGGETGGEERDPPDRRGAARRIELAST